MPGIMTIRHPNGFTLIEILVVLVMIGLLAAVALPGMMRMKESVEYANQRDQILSSITSLSYQAYVTGQPITLKGESLPFRLPDGWTLETPNPIAYNFNGACSGGQMDIISPNGRRESFDLQPPRCRPQG